MDLALGLVTEVQHWDRERYGVVLAIQTAGELKVRLRNWFPEREFFMRSQGQVRFLTITTRMQVIAAAIVLAVSVGWVVSMGVMAFEQYRSSSQRSSLLHREARVAKAQERVNAYRKDLAATAADLEKRQAVLEQAFPMLPRNAVAKEPKLAPSADTVTDSTAESNKLISMVKDSIPEAEGLAKVEASQLALVERLTRYADSRSAAAEKALRKLGLSPHMVLAASERDVGGPFIKISSETNGTLDPRFKRMILSLARLQALEHGLNGIPHEMPTDYERISSPFGYRRDPYTGQPAMHPGIDFAAPRGTPIDAAADGTVSFVGRIHGYGNVVQITHDNGIMTRYAHMERQKAHVGEIVKAGEVIGFVGSTGRSTGPHLHFEVRINGRAVNPEPFLETAPHVLKETRAEFARATTGDTHSNE